MCYDVKSQTLAKIKYAKHIGASEAEIAELEQKFMALPAKQYYHVSGFAHPGLVTVRKNGELTPEVRTWGLVPGWTKSKADADKNRKNTLNARFETAHEKASFRTSFKSKRCLILIDGFYEFHHAAGKTYPFHISGSDGEPISVAGLYEDWTDKESGELLQTVVMVTTSASKIMQKIHNNPKLEFGPRRPALLSKDHQMEWLSDNSKDVLQDLLQSFDEDMLKYHTAPPLKGKAAVGNCEDAEKEYIYEDLNFIK